jgi:hypothetical protein
LVSAKDVEMVTTTISNKILIFFMGFLFEFIFVFLFISLYYIHILLQMSTFFDIYSFYLFVFVFKEENYILRTIKYISIYFVNLSYVASYFWWWCPCRICQRKKNPTV